MATVEVVSATTAFHAEKVEEPNKMEEPTKTDQETAATVVEEEAAIAPATPEVAKEAETTLNDVVSDESAVLTNGEGTTVAEAKATEDEVKVESIPKEVVTTVEEEKKSEEEEEQVVAPVEITAVAENFSDAPVEMEPEADTEAKVEAEVAKEDAVTGTHDEEEKPIKEGEDKVDEKVEAEAPAVSEAEEAIKKTEE